jgi:hypothetical protein
MAPVAVTKMSYQNVGCRILAANSTISVTFPRHDCGFMASIGWHEICGTQVPAFLFN